VKFADGTVTDASWKAKVVMHGPIDRDTANPKVRNDPIPQGWKPRWTTKPDTKPWTGQ
jgi:hypothetical protein